MLIDFQKGEKFVNEIKIFDNNDIAKINDLIQKILKIVRGEDLLTYFLTVKIVCNILNKYQIKT